ncbi:MULTISPECIES: nucleotidyltransferase [Vibrio]|uniref:Cyclic GMP-AMP synthase n=1 Tax=Vibrio kanaloae TaxID=170673 RepID=A0A4U1ZTM2_9VIBR|nr:MULTISPECIES: nucleotidyltransferase [Vibrio]MCX8859959.1 nucleotidyltransferase [Vibrio parahaemolyticus]MCX8865135.1 nucleotidyltransferase [Vibrio parahaemolyticus]MCX8870260.1 nucleotidyltransferase [Vibrio parahaemolyticus]MCX8900475.1 nucleotidyltransferase [Vibrio parahaemolyticus]MCX8920775.1 nucleotidyltransferase [Vibrio parahaemolyticus]
MSETHYSYLVNEAINRRNEQVQKTLRKSFSFESFQDSSQRLEGLVEDIKLVNDHIKVDGSVFDDASSDYESIATKLVEKLQWPNESIRIIPQGSASTQTLIRSPDNSKFDIDAVCSVDLSMIEVDEPMDFYEKVGSALEEWDPEPKKRCWKVDFQGRRYYIEFTPSTPLDKVPQSASNRITFSPSNRYRYKALAVVDTPSKQWKTSNPEGFSSWVSDQSSRPLLRWLLEKSMRDSYSAESVTPVPAQEVEISDTLRMAIRLLKRHRDMAVRRNYIEPDLKPISIIIVTLLTQCYEGLADKGAVYTHPIELLIDLVELMPYMVEWKENEYWIANPTVEGENFAEKWNEKPRLKQSFDTWTKLLLEDLNHIMAATDQDSRRQTIKEVFGCTAAHRPTPPNVGGLAPRKPSQTHKAPPTKGLA